MLQRLPSPPARRPQRVLRSLERELVARLRRRYFEAPIRLVLWGGDELSLGDGPPAATVWVRDRTALLKLLWDPLRFFPELYCAGALEVADLPRAFELAFRGWKHDPASVRSWLPFARRRPRREDVRAHYDRGNDFYSLWLDEEMLYTCAYFETGRETLEAAQRAKMDYVARKLRLAPGEHVLDAGCGWGGLAIHLARHYGVIVRACNVSRPQLDHAWRRVLREGLHGQVELIEDDFRSVGGRYDAVVSVGMLEHVGKAAYGELGRWLGARLDPARGRALLHFIGRRRPAPIDGWIGRHIFPGAYPPTLSEVASLALEPQGLVVTDVENLRGHYALTLGHWLERFERSADLVRREYGDRFARAWRVYLAGSKATFTTGFLELFQVTLAAPGNGDQPLTRSHLYREAEAELGARSGR